MQASVSTQTRVRQDAIAVCKDAIAVCKDLVEMSGFEPLASCLQGRRSTN